MALNVNMVRRDGVPSDQWGFPVRGLTIYHVADGGASAALAGGAQFVPTAGRMYWVSGTGALLDVETHTGGGWAGISNMAVLLIFNWYQVAIAAAGAMRLNNTGAPALTYICSWRQVV